MPITVPVQYNLKSNSIKLDNFGDFMPFFLRFCSKKSPLYFWSKSGNCNKN